MTLHHCVYFNFKFSGNLKFSLEGVALNKIQSEDWELPLVDFKRIVKATDNFSEDNKLGEGGFGPVYKVIILVHSMCKITRMQNVD